MRTDRSAEAKASSTTWLLPFVAGSAFWSSFGVVYELCQRHSPEVE